MKRREALELKRGDKVTVNDPEHATQTTGIVYDVIPALLPGPYICIDFEDGKTKQFREASVKRITE